ncbi:MAG: hypothetical protein A3F68_12905 [Acidobacteria bacterium RIFCSPLOWO2_12_FULL_54_10]|nr:MAG: hypothetical protein A3F68_12905 [Acidobacteria bacterium RIFCSPLOWO2_12_FULL_54_10]
MTWIKICGIKRLQDAETAVAEGANALGFNFWKGTKRYIDPDEAARIVTKMPASVWCVGVFVDETVERVLEIVRLSGVNCVQLHDSEGPEYLDRLSHLKTFKVFKVKSNFKPEALLSFPSVTAFLLDAYVEGVPGGTGQAFDWASAVQAKRYGKVILAGGLNPGNVAKAVEFVQPWGVDVASGVEVEPGIKCPETIRNFIRAVKEADKKLLDQSQHSSVADKNHAHELL